MTGDALTSGATPSPPKVDDTLGGLIGLTSARAVVKRIVSSRVIATPSDAYSPFGCIVIHHRREEGRCADWLDGELPVITGAANGIGRAIALAMAEAGAGVALVDRDESGLTDATALLRSSGGTADCFPADVSDQAEVVKAVEKAAHKLGDPTILVAAAGIDQSKHLAEITQPEWQTMVDVNLSGCFYCLQAVLPAMKRRGYGRVVLIGSNIALKGGADIAHYGAAKAGVHGLARCAALDLAPLNITVNVVAPGPVEPTCSGRCRRNGLMQNELSF